MSRDCRRSILRTGEIDIEVDCIAAVAGKE
jgi:hypothetical protein